MLISRLFFSEDSPILSEEDYEVCIGQEQQTKLGLKLLTSKFWQCGSATLNNNVKIEKGAINSLFCYIDFTCSFEDN